MQLDVSRVAYDGQWYDFGGSRVKVRPFPATKISFWIKDGAMEVSGDQTFAKFDYCLEAWEGFVTPDGTPIPLTAEVKRKIYDFHLGVAEVDGVQTELVAFVTSTADAMAAAMRSAEKNS